MTVLIYRLFLIPFAKLLVFALRPLLSEKIKDILETREKMPFEIRTPLKKVIWFHCSSGEFEYARSMIRLIKKQHPESQILVTYFSTSFVEPIRKMPEVDALGPLPLDTPRDIKKFLDQFPIELALFSRTDVWPEMSSELRKRKIPSYLFSLSLSEKSTRSQFPTSLITKWALSELNGIFCVSQDDLLALQKLNVKTPAAVTGDTRYDQVFHRLANRKPIKDLRQSSNFHVCVAGSTWAEDEAVLIPAFSSLPDSFRLILVPHEPTPEHLESLKKQLEACHLSYALYSQVQTWSEKILIVDQIGILAELYSCGNSAFVGGSFKKTVHSVMEPLALGLPTLVGPFYHNNREALAFGQFSVGENLSAVIEVISIEGTKEILLKLQSSDLQNISKKILQKMAESRGASEKTWQLITKDLP
ncbi:MAG: 3-deoxy-D-manno-octulosonic acid transferase [Pseudobdellovibrionaceae bacterium]